VFRCPDLASGTLSGAPQGGAATSVQVTLEQSGSRAEAGRVACFYSSSPNRDVRDYRVTFPCPGLVAAPTTTIADGTSNTISLGTPSGAATTPAQYTCRTR
jgi:hypothetical protein